MLKKKIFEFKPYEKALFVTEEKSIRDMVALMVAHREIHHLCVIDEEKKLIGLVGRKRLFRAVFSHHVPADSRIHELFTLLTSENASDLVLRDVLTIKEDEEIDKAIAIFTQKNLFELPVVDENRRVLGFITVDMVLKEWLSEVEKSGT